VSGARLALDPLQHLEPIHFGQLEIQQNDSRRYRRPLTAVLGKAIQKLERSRAIANHADVVSQALFAQGRQGQFDIVWIVFNQQDLNSGIRHSLRFLSK
jgi:hypothetical protein